MADINKMAQMSGENTRPPKYDLPIIRFNGKDGKFFKIIKDEAGETQRVELGETMKGITLKFRRVFNEFTNRVHVFTSEHNTWKDEVVLFERKEGEKKANMIDAGPINSLREKYQKLKMTQIVYFLLDGKEIVRLEIKGKGFSNYLDFRKKFEKEYPNQHLFQYWIKIGFQEEQGKLGSFYSMNFEVDKEVEDLDSVAEKMEEVNSKLQEIDDFYKRQGPPPEMAEVNSGRDDIPTIEDDGESMEKSEDEIDPKDIPF